MWQPSIPNAHVLLIPESEAQFLAGVIGRRLERIRFDGLTSSLEFDSCALMAHPEPGAGGSPAFPKEEIMRLSVGAITPGESAYLDSSSRLKQLDLGKRVSDVHILHSLVVFGEPVEVGPQRLTDSVQLPAGLGYGVECINPSRVAQRHLEQLAQRGCANLVDIGIVISLEGADSVVVRTDGSSWRVFVTAEEKGSAHQEIAVTVALDDRGADPLSRPPSSC
jgi:hypothetical protein